MKIFYRLKVNETGQVYELYSRSQLAVIMSDLRSKNMTWTVEIL